MIGAYSGIIAHSAQFEFIQKEQLARERPQKYYAHSAVIKSCNMQQKATAGLRRRSSTTHSARRKRGVVLSLYGSRLVLFSRRWASAHRHRKYKMDAPHLAISPAAHACPYNRKTAIDYKII